MSNSPPSVTQAENATEPVGEGEEGGQAAWKREGRYWGGMTAAEAAERRAEVQREKRAQRDREEQLGRMTLKGRLSVALSAMSQADLDKLVKTLTKATIEGDTKAGHLLVRLIEAVQGKAPAEDAPDPTGAGEEKPLEAMTPGERQAAMAALLRKVEEDRALGDETDPRAED